VFYIVLYCIVVLILKFIVGAEGAENWVERSDERKFQKNDGAERSVEQ